MLKKAFLIVSGVLLTITILSLAVNIADDSKVKSIRDGMDTRLLSFNVAKIKAEKVKDLISISDQESYNTQMVYFKDSMTTELHTEYFPTKKYLGGEKVFTIKEQRLSGEEVAPNSFVFKLELDILSDNNPSTLILYVFIKDNLIFKIKSLG